MLRTRKTYNSPVKTSWSAVLVAGLLKSLLHTGHVELEVISNEDKALELEVLFRLHLPNGAAIFVDDDRVVASILSCSVGGLLPLLFTNTS
jgi:hypothetical protein